MGAWIETAPLFEPVINATSHPAWVRGLKLGDCLDHLSIDRSHPAWVRGLKPESHLMNRVNPTVAPRVGAWIETWPLSAVTVY